MSRYVNATFTLLSGEKPPVETGWNAGPVWAKRKISRLVRTQTPVPPLQAHILVTRVTQLSWLPCLYWHSCSGCLICFNWAVLAPLFVLIQLSWLPFLFWLSCPGSLFYSDSAVLAPFFILTQLSWLPFLFWLNCPGCLFYSDSAVLAPFFILTQLSWLPFLFWLSCPGSIFYSDSTVLAPFFILTQLSWLPFFILTQLSWLPWLLTQLSRLPYLYLLSSLSSLTLNYYKSNEVSGMMSVFRVPVGKLKGNPFRLPI